MDVKNTAQQFREWLVNERHIDIAIAAKAGVRFTGSLVEIPVRDINGHPVFYKYRRSPFTDDGPKYTYAKGSSASIFGLETIKEGTIIITEGELDALALRTIGYMAVSTTGGAGTWKPEWRNYFKNTNPIIAYDADRAGVEGALRVASLLPGAKIAWLPVQYGKDATDIIHSDNTLALKLAISEAREYVVSDTKDLDNDRLESFKRLRSRLSEEREELNRGRYTTPFHRDLALAWVENEIAILKDKLNKPWRRPYAETDDRLERAKRYPISELVSVNREGFTKCVYHEEKNASMKVYRDNHCFSYCCGKRSDAIDIYCAIHPGVSFKQAIENLAL